MRRIGASGVQLLPLLVVAAMVVQPAALAYPVDAGGFADGTDSSTLTFVRGTTSLLGPSLRLPTNATLAAGTIEVSAGYGTWNRSWQDSNLGDFTSGQADSGIRVNAGNLTLTTGGSVVTLDVANAFGNASLSGTTLTGGRLWGAAATTGTFLTENVSSPPTGWGVLRARGTFPQGTGLVLDVLSPTGSLLVEGHPIGAPLDVDSLSAPRVRFRGTLSSVNSEAPSLEALQVGQRAGDAFYGTGVSRTLVNTDIATAGGLTPQPNFASFQRHRSNPLLSGAASTWYADGVSQPFLMKVGAQYWLYFVGRDSPSGLFKIGRATSMDGFNWTVGSSPVLNQTAASWDDFDMKGIHVVPNPSGSGYVMYYAIENAATFAGAIGRATSTDGVTWTKDTANPLLVPSATGWDTVGVSYLYGVNYTNGSWKLWYGATTQTAPPLQMAVGLAMSSDGVNWTKHAGNPVQTPTQTYEAADTNAGGMLFLPQVTHFYYGCNAAGSYDICLSSSTNGGTTWTKSGVAISRGGGWDNQITCPTPLLDNGGVIVYFLGFGGGLQIGRADSHFRPASITGRIDFGANIPFDITAAAVNATRPTGSTVGLTLRSSTDGSSWSTPESIAVGPSMTTPARRFLEWTVNMTATASLGAPHVAEVTVNYTAYHSAGTFVSREFALSDEIVSVNLTVDAPRGFTGITIEASDDGGTNWVTAMSGIPFSISPVASNLSYRLTLAATPPSAPVVDAVTVGVLFRGLPADVSVALGLGSTPFYATTGPMAGGANLSLPVAHVNQLIAAARISQPGAATIDVPLIVTSSHFGEVTVAHPRLTWIYKNPLSVEYAPAGTSLAVDENTSATFSATATSYPPTVPANASWFVDGAEVTAARGAPTFTYTPSFSDSGPHSVRAHVENGDFFLNHTWDVVVNDVNRPPQVAATPPSPLSLSHTGSVTLIANAVDPDNDPLTYAWQVDSNLQLSTDSQLIVAGLSTGAHVIVLAVSDGTATASATWQVQATDTAPSTTRVPAGDVNMSHSASRVFQVIATDADGDSFTYSWTLDGNAVAATGASYTLANPATGPHTLRVVVTAGGASSTVQWSLTSTNSAPTITLQSPGSSAVHPRGASTTLSVVATDTDNDTLTYEWYVDEQVQTTTGASVMLGELSAGSHTVRVVVSDPGGLEDEAIFAVSATVPPETSTPGPSASWTVMALLAAGGATGMLALRRRRDGVRRR